MLQKNSFSFSTIKLWVQKLCNFFILLIKIWGWSHSGVEYICMCPSNKIQTAERISVASIRYVFSILSPNLSSLYYKFYGHANATFRVHNLFFVYCTIWHSTFIDSFHVYRVWHQQQRLFPLIHLNLIIIDIAMLYRFWQWNWLINGYCKV